MVWWSKKKPTDETDPSTDQALALQDPRTRVNTTSAATQTTKTAVQNSTIIDSNKNTVIYTTTSRTVTHTQQARVTEMITRRTPSQAELDELFAQLHMNGGGGVGGGNGFGVGSGGGGLGGSSGNRRSRLDGVALRSTPSFKHNTDAKRSSTVFKTEQTTSSQKQGRTVTQHVETQRLVLNPKPTWPPRTTATGGSSNSSSSSINSTTLVPFGSKPQDRAYVSPYAKGNLSGGPSIVTPTNKIVLSSPKITSTPKSTVFTRPTLSTPKVTSPQPFISLNAGTGAVPKRYASSITSTDAKGELKPTVPEPKVNKKKLKPAEVIIFNSEKFDANDFRKGSAEDVKALNDTFKELKCKVQVIQNPTVADVKSAVRKLELRNFDDRSALVVVIMTHGQRNDTLAAKDGEYKLDDHVIFPIVRNRSLQNKPKILFVQACKGAREIGGFNTDSVQPHGIPSEILKCYSTYEGYVSYRHDEGTPFIQMLCEILRKKPNVDIATIMEEVRCLVKTYTKDGQIPSVTTTLTSKYVFGDYT
ncbi:hypothetical protein KR222_002215 [Zaprionus bogoriensis]|nr:hypothetical protein KR222_002215 [Zaprionus bogoriensis]